MNLSRFSGLTIAQVEAAKDTLSTAFDQMRRLINRETILIGHSLESDLKSMHIGWWSYFCLDFVYCAVVLFFLLFISSPQL